MESKKFNSPSLKLLGLLETTVVVHEGPACAAHSCVYVHLHIEREDFHKVSTITH